MPVAVPSHPPLPRTLVDPELLAFNCQLDSKLHEAEAKTLKDLRPKTSCELVNQLRVETLNPETGAPTRVQFVSGALFEVHDVLRYPDRLTVWKRDFV